MAGEPGELGKIADQPGDDEKKRKEERGRMGFAEIYPNEYLTEAEALDITELERRIAALYEEVRVNDAQYGPGNFASKATMKKLGAFEKVLREKRNAERP